MNSTFVQDWSQGVGPWDYGAGFKSVKTEVEGKWYTEDGQEHTGRFIVRMTKTQCRVVFCPDSFDGSAYSKEDVTAAIEEEYIKHFDGECPDIKW